MDEIEYNLTTKWLPSLSKSTDLLLSKDFIRDLYEIAVC